MTEICDLHARLVANLRLGLSVFLNGDLKSAQQLLAQKVLFRDLERGYADTHLEPPRGQDASTASRPRRCTSTSSPTCAASTRTSARSPTRSSSTPACWRARGSRSRSPARCGATAAARPTSSPASRAGMTRDAADPSPIRPLADGDLTPIAADIALARIARNRRPAPSTPASRVTQLEHALQAAAAAEDGRRAASARRRRRCCTTSATC